MHSLEITLQHARDGTWPVVAEHRRPGGLPARAEGQLLPAPDLASCEAFETGLAIMFGDLTVGSRRPVAVSMTTVERAA